MDNHVSSQKGAQRMGINIFIVLMVLTVLEFIFSVYINSIVALLIIMIIKAALIVYYFMHVYRVWREESH